MPTLNIRHTLLENVENPVEDTNRHATIVAMRCVLRTISYRVGDRQRKFVDMQKNDIKML